jgi:hypothetical protein
VRKILDMKTLTIAAALPLLPALAAEVRSAKPAYDLSDRVKAALRPFAICNCGTIATNRGTYGNKFCTKHRPEGAKALKGAADLDVLESWLFG